MATYDEADATKIVKNAIVDYGITTPIDIKNNTLGKYPLELSPGTDYARLLGYINLGIANPKNKFTQDILNKWSPTTKVIDLITMVEYAPTGSPPKGSSSKASPPRGASPKGSRSKGG